MNLFKYLSCGCGIDSEGGREYCPECVAKLIKLLTEEKVYCSGENTGCDHEDKPTLKECSDCPYMSTIEPRQGVGRPMSEQDELLLTPEEAINLLTNEQLFSMSPKDAEKIGEIQKQTAQAQLAKAKKQERERVIALIDTKKDLVHDGYHGYAGKTPNPSCKGCQIEQALKGETDDKA